MKYAHKKRLEAVVKLLLKAKELLTKNRLESKLVRGGIAEKVIGTDPAQLAYEDLDTILDGSVGLVGALLEDRVEAFLETLREDLTDDDNPDPDRGP